MAQYKSLVSFAAVMALLGCGDDDDGGGGKKAAVDSVESACAATCDRMRAARCSLDLTGCETACEQEAAQVPFSCRALADQMLDCASKATFSCGLEGPVATFCSSIEAQLDVCTAGPTIPAPATDASAQVPSVNDAATNGNVGNHDAGAGLADASAPRSDASVVPPVADAGTDASAPRPDAGTVEVLSCELDVDDEPCDRCMKRSCCTSFQACGPACQVLAECIAECETDACIDSCAARYPAGTATFNALLQCTANNCATECSDDMPMPPPRTTMRPPPADKCLPIVVPAGTCTNPSRPHGYDCASQPFADCVLLPNIADVYCCG